MVDFIAKHKAFFEENSLSFFEMTVGLAFDYFRSEEIDIAIIELDLGGRLDSTNVVTPEISAITNIGLDHMDFLGATIEDIAAVFRPVATDWRYTTESYNNTTRTSASWYIRTCGSSSGSTRAK